MGSVTSEMNALREKSEYESAPGVRGVVFRGPPSENPSMQPRHVVTKATGVELPEGSGPFFCSSIAQIVLDVSFGMSGWLAVYRRSSNSSHPSVFKSFDDWLAPRVASTPHSHW